MNNINSHYLIYCIKNFFVRFLKFFGFTFRLIVFENYSADRRRCDYRRFVFKKNSRCHKIILSDFYLYYAKPPLLKATVYCLNNSYNDLFSIGRANKQSLSVIIISLYNNTINIKALVRRTSRKKQQNIFRKSF